MTERELDQLVDLDHHAHEALLAIDPRAHASERAQQRPCFPIGRRLSDQWSPAPLGAAAGEPAPSEWTAPEGVR
jgi:hypothetical protein